MAEEREPGTERPSERRLERARREGRVPVARDLVAWASFAGGALALAAVGAELARSLAGMVGEFIRCAGRQVVPAPGLLERPLVLAARVVAAAAGAALAATLAQTRGGVWPALAAPDARRLASGRILGLFRGESAQATALSVVKVLALGGAICAALDDDFLTLGELALLPPSEALARLGTRLAHALLPVLAVAAAVGGLDLALTRRRHFADMRMTKDELRREMREEEGDPLARSRRRVRHRELLRGRPRSEVPKADLVVVNPTHLAVALRYRRDEGRAPRVLAKGRGRLAELIRQVACESGVPVTQDVPLARLLYRKVRVGGEIPAETWRTVARLLAFVYRRTGRAAAAGAS